MAVEYFKITTITPKGDSREYMYMGDIDIKDPKTIEDFYKFMVDCCDDTADFFSCPDDWDPIKWRDSTCAKWEDPEGKRSDFGIPFCNPFVR